MTDWLKAIDQVKFTKKTGVTLSGRELLVAAHDFEQEVGHDNLAAMPLERVELTFAAYLRKWVKRFQRKTPAIRE